MHSISDLTTYCRRTTGDVPAKLVVCQFNTTPHSPHLLNFLIYQGASTTVVGTKMYLFVSHISLYMLLSSLNHPHREVVWSPSVGWSQIYMCSTWKTIVGRNCSQMMKMTHLELVIFIAPILVCPNLRSFNYAQFVGQGTTNWLYSEA